MNFLSVKEFFYKINTIGFILLLMSVMVFVFLHYFTLDRFPAVFDPREQMLLLETLVPITVVGLTIVHWLCRLRMQRLRLQAELAKKMDGYFVLVVIRHGSYVVASLIMAVGYYLTHSAYFTGAFFVMVLVLLAQWPGPARFCLAFGLRGPERDLVMHNRDLPRKSRKV